MGDIEKEEEANVLNEKSSEGETTHETSEQVSSKDQENTDKSTECEFKDETKNKEKEKEVKKIDEKFSEGEVNDKIAESSEQISSMDQETTEKSDKECTSNEIDVKTEEIETIGIIDEIDESQVESKNKIETSEQVSECEIKDEIEEIEKEHIAMI